MKDHEIIELYWARNESAIAATAEKYGSYCHTIAYNILHSNEDAEEFSKAIGNRTGFHVKNLLLDVFADI